MPAFLRILHARFILLGIHIKHIQRAGILTGPASGAEFLVNYWRHARYSLFILDRQKRGECSSLRILPDRDLAEPVSVVRLGKVEAIVTLAETAFFSV